MKTETKRAIRRFALRCLRKLVDLVDDRLHAAEVSLREEIAGRKAACIEAARPTTGQYVPAAASSHETFAAWTARRAGIAPTSKKEAQRQRRRTSARDFDLRYAR